LLQIYFLDRIPSSDLGIWSRSNYS